MIEKAGRWYLMIVLILTLSAAFFILPALGGSVFMSPDETAVAVMGRHLAETGSLKIDLDLLKDFPWLHPRSLVTQDSHLAPVGFLGLPVIASVLWRIFGSAGLVLFTPLLALSVIFPLWRFSRSWGRLSQMATIVGWLTFPTVILYANRGLFPNLVVVCLAVWAAWLIWADQKRWMMVLAGALTGLALMIRPTEFFWVLPWVAAAYLIKRPTEQGSNRIRERIISVVLFIAPLVLICLIGAFAAWKTYGSPFAFGYQLRDTTINYQLSTTNYQLQTTNYKLFDWPFGFHPRNVWFNLHSYLIEYLAPWFALVMTALVLSWKDKKSRPFIYLSGWTIVSLALFYGQSLYQDHVRINEISLANSFLRYTIPVSVIAALSIGWFIKWLREKFEKTGIIFSVIILALIGSFGIWTALARDDEGLGQNQRELIRYSIIREQAEQLLDPTTVVLSERSDKIFFPKFLAVSPRPSDERILQLLESEKKPVALFIRTLDEKAARLWFEKGIILEPVLNAGNETLYRALIFHPPSG